MYTYICIYVYTYMHMFMYVYVCVCVCSCVHEGESSKEKHFYDSSLNTHTQHTHTHTYKGEGGGFSLGLITRGYIFAEHVSVAENGTDQVAENGSSCADACALGARDGLWMLSGDAQLWLFDCLASWCSYLRHMTAGALDTAPRHTLAAARRSVAGMQYACARLLCRSQAQTGGVHALGAGGFGGTSGAIDVFVSKHFGRLVALAAQALEWLPKPTSDSSSTAASAASLFVSHSTSGAAWEKHDQGLATRKERNECKDTAMRRCAAFRKQQQQQGAAAEDEAAAQASNFAPSFQASNFAAAEAERRIAAYLTQVPSYDMHVSSSSYDMHVSDAGSRGSLCLSDTCRHCSSLPGTPRDGGCLGPPPLVRLFFSAGRRGRHWAR